MIRLPVITRMQDKKMEESVIETQLSKRKGKEPTQEAIKDVPSKERKAPPSQKEGPPPNKP